MTALSALKSEIVAIDRTTDTMRETCERLQPRFELHFIGAGYYEITGPDGEKYSSVYDPLFESYDLFQGPKCLMESGFREAEKAVAWLEERRDEG